MRNLILANDITDYSVTQIIEMISSATVYEVADISALHPAKRLTRRLDNTIWFKREDQQTVFSFKLRGAYNKISHLDEAQKKAGIIAASAGNHAQGVALAAQRLNIKATIVMPVTTPSIKVDSVRAMGAEVVLHGDNYDAACTHAYQLTQDQNKVFIHPYDDIEVIAGQGTIGKEILEQSDMHIDAVFVPVGGGGLIAGVSTWIKHFSPSTKIIGVEPEDAPTLFTALQSGERVKLDQVGIFADGVAVKQIGLNTFELAKKYVDEVILVSIDELCAGIKDIFDDTRVVSEPAGALAIAGVKKYVQREKCKNLNLVAINSGANMNFDRLRHVTERTELGEGREGLFAVTIPECKGSFLRFCTLIGNHSISEFNYRYASESEAHIFVGIKFEDALKEKSSLIEMLKSHQYPVTDLSDNEMAKLHLRHLVGGHSPQSQYEVIYRFEFPERPGALLEFLSVMGSQWNITLFHYRNHGAAYGRVLVGAQVPPSEVDDFKEFLRKVGYTYYDETANPIYELFLK